MVKMKFKLLFLSTIFLASCSQKRIQPNHLPTVKTSEQNETSEIKPTLPTTNEPIQGSVESSNQAPPPVLNNKVLPKFAFIFSGGGAKAWGHIGFLRITEAEVARAFSSWV